MQNRKISPSIWFVGHARGCIRAPAARYHPRTLSDTPAPSHRVRLFIAFTLPAEIVVRILDWQRRTMTAAGVRLMTEAQLHITAVFLGTRPQSDVADVCGLVADHVRTARQPMFAARRYRETSRVGMIQLSEQPLAGDSYVGRANALVGHLMRDLEARRLYRREYRSWRPHVTVSRFRMAPGLRLDPPDLGTFSPTEVALFRSVATPEGSTYERLGGQTFA